MLRPAALPADECRRAPCPDRAGGGRSFLRHTRRRDTARRRIRDGYRARWPVPVPLDEQSVVAPGYGHGQRIHDGHAAVLPSRLGDTGMYLRGLPGRWDSRRSRPPHDDAALNPFGTRAELTLDGGPAVIFRPSELERKGVGTLDRLPFSIRVLLENALRHAGRGVVTEDHVAALAQWSRPARLGRRNPLHAGPGGAPGLYRRALRGRPRGNAGRDGPHGGQPRPDQSGRSLRSGDRSLGPGGPLWNAPTRSARTWRWNLSATPSAINSSSLPSGLSPDSGWSPRDRHRPPGQPRVPGPGGPAPRTSTASAPPIPTPWSAPIRTPR